MSNFNKLLSLDVNHKKEKKGQFDYLSWAFAWAEFKKVYPDARYNIKKDECNNAYFGSAETGFMVYTEVDAGGLKYEMWLPVMDFKNKAMLKPSVMDINKAIMRCLVKNLAMFGLGLYIYAGEDLPEIQKPDCNYKTNIKVQNAVKSWRQKLLPAFEQIAQLETKYNLSDEDKVLINPPLTSELIDSFKTLFHENKELEMYIFSRRGTETNEQWLELQNNFEKGEKTACKAKLNKMVSNGRKIFDAQLSEWIEADKKQDDSYKKQLEGELPPHGVDMLQTRKEALSL